MRSTVSVAVKPVILGGGRLAIKTAFSLFTRYMLSSCVFSEELPFYRRLLLFARFRELPKTKNDTLTLMELEHFVNEYGELTYLLIPCTKALAAFVSRNRDALEDKFIIRSPEEILTQRELFPLVATSGKD